MARVGSKDTRPEMRLRKELWRRGLRYRIHYSVAGVKPDMVFLGPMVAVFVDGCFWHGCPIHYAPPRTRKAFWAAKLLTNVERDLRQYQQLVEAGWRVLRFWEHEIELDLNMIAFDVLVANRGEKSGRSSWRVREAETEGEHTVKYTLVSLDGSEVETVIKVRNKALSHRIRR